MNVTNFRFEMTPQGFNSRAEGHLGGLIGLEVLSVAPEGMLWPNA